MLDKFDLMTKPYIWDLKYDNMSKQERLLNYERDLMLYHQTLAIKNIANTSTNVSIQDTPADYDLKQLKSNMLSDAEYYALNGLEYGSPEYIKYNDLKQKANALVNKANYLALNVKGFIWFLLIVVICLGVPAMFITTNMQLKILAGLALIIVPISYIFVNYLAKTYMKQAHALRNQKLQIIYNIKKQQTNKQQHKEVLNLQH